ncbi:MAG TPA: TldD/PmbA family protein [Thermotogota bacterium]|nr:TldD/PmbA family protein [Thermotogota bacterium]HRW93392.1 TldD/PmbA family protein [Thermotogota bacterium]
MNYHEFRTKVFEHATQAGLQQFELFAMDSDEFEVMVHGGKVNQYKDAQSMGASLKVIRDGKTGFSYTEVFDASQAEFLVKDALENLQVNESTDIESLYEGPAEYENVSPYANEFQQLDASEKIEQALRMEKAALAQDPRIQMVPFCVYTHFSSRTYIDDSTGRQLFFHSGGGLGYIQALAQSGEKKKDGFHYWMGKNPSGLNPEELGKVAAQKAIQSLEAHSVGSGKYRVILQNEVFASFLTLFVSMLSAESVQKGFSLLQGKLGQQVLSPVLTIDDDPFFPGSMFNCPFDSQAVPTRKKSIVERGTLKTFLHSLKTAQKDGVSPTGNGFRSGYRGTESIHPVNLVVRGGEFDPEGLQQQLGDGLLITDTQGMHSGADPVSGKFSVGASGFRVKDGKILHPVEQITIAGNLLELLSSVEHVGTDGKFGFVFSYGLHAPSVLLPQLDVAGDAD